MAKDKENRLGINPLDWIKKTSTNDEPSNEDSGIRLINLDDIELNPDQPRKTFAIKEMGELKASIKKDGLLQSIVIAPLENNSKFLLVAGERRYRASRELGLKQIPAMVTKGDPSEIALIENIHRENLNPVEEAIGYENLMEKHGYTQEQLSKVIGKDRTLISKMLKLTALPESVKQKCATSHITRKEVLFNVAKLENENEMLDLIDKVESGNLNVKQVRELAKDVKGKPVNNNSKITPVIKHGNALLKILKFSGGLDEEEKAKIKELYVAIGELDVEIL